MDANRISVPPSEHARDWWRGGARRLVRFRLRLLADGFGALNPGEADSVLRNVSIPRVVRVDSSNIKAQEDEEEGREE